MNFFQRFIFIISLILLSSNNSFSVEKIAFIDIDYIIQNSSIGKKMLTEINNIDKKKCK